MTDGDEISKLRNETESHSMRTFAVLTARNGKRRLQDSGTSPDDSQKRRRPASFA
jgi:hypothetical protein